MNTNKFLLGGIIGGIASFLLGWLVWGTLLMNFMKENSNQTSGVFRSADEMVWWALIAGNLAMGFLLSFVLNKAKINTAGGGAFTGAAVGLFTAIGVDCMMYAQVYLFNAKAMAVDVAASVIVSAIVGATIGWFNGRGAKATA
jgi:hypothetical protein